MIVLILLMCSPVYAQKAPVGEVMRAQDLLNDRDALVRQIDYDGRVLVRKIMITGFVPKDRKPFESAFKPYLNKRLFPSDIDALIAEVKYLYAQEGYQELVQISYTLNRHILKISVSFVSG